MNAKQDNKVGKFRSVKLACDQPSPVWGSVSEFFDIYTNASAIVDNASGRNSGEDTAQANAT